jgi:hypothetical protein
VAAAAKPFYADFLCGLAALPGGCFLRPSIGISMLLSAGLMLGAEVKMLAR